jgi:AcrR family transcriptional regulator
MTKGLKKSEKTKQKLINAVISLIQQGDRVISVASITKKAKTAYGSFYRYFDNLDQIHAIAIETLVLSMAAEEEKKLSKEKSNLFKVYYVWYKAIDLFKEDNVANWLMDHPASIFDAWTLTQPMTSGWVKAAIKNKEISSLSKKNLEHFEMAQQYIWWMYQQCLRELIKGRRSLDVYLEVMQSINFLDLPRKTHQSFLQKVIDRAN